MGREGTKEYKNKELRIVWRPKLCIHAGECVKRLPQVYDPKKRPWVTAENASVEALVDQIDHCPSGALSYYYNEKDKTSVPPSDNEVCVKLITNGPLIVEGDFEIKDQEGNIRYLTGKTTLCRCGASENKPFCDGAHKNIGFNTES